MLNSIISHPFRSKKYGNPNWRGNCAGEVVLDLLNWFRPRVFVDPAVGSGTSADVVKELNSKGSNIEFHGLDLHSGFNLLKDSLSDRIGGKRADYVLFHPPYHSVIPYSSKQWGTKVHPGDLSHCPSYEDFLCKMTIALRNIYDSLANQGKYSILVGDLRKNGEYISIQSDLLQLAPGKLTGIFIKTQHNTVSSRKTYSNLNFVPISHEYILNFENSRLVFGLVDTSLAISRKLEILSKANWKSTIYQALLKLGGQASLNDIYQIIEADAPDKTKPRPHWRERVRAELQKSFISIERGIWATA